MSRVFVCGSGAVSPAGWDVPALRQALRQGLPLAVEPLARPGWSKPLRSRPIPAPAGRPAFLSHPKLRRASPITHYAAAATLEALAPLRAAAGTNCRLGVVVCLNAGCVQYSCRFWAEVLQDPATASPLLFPETVFAAPTSHVCALLENTPSVYTLIGDPATFLQGLSLAIDWLEERRVEACVVIGAEEPHWLLADALWHLEHSAILSGGAGALCVSLNPAWSLGAELTAITSAHTITRRAGRRAAAQAMRRELPACRPGELLCDGVGDSYRASAPELAAWRDWTGPRLSPKRILGEGLMAAAAWQCVAGIDALAAGQCAGANVSLVGGSQQAIGARFERVRPGAELDQAVP
ncbi:MAG TPA: hypothetical protein VNT26_10745 [Candidatus Sulfotelmatobacter sp.]|nr:hypothetical protein [Candidatus Sulfotelmatobacter sp.]HWI59220.1 hypothetical protein [Bacillota bacterium]